MAKNDKIGPMRQIENYQNNKFLVFSKLSENFIKEIFLQMMELQLKKQNSLLIMALTSSVLWIKIAI